VGLGDEVAPDGEGTHKAGLFGQGEVEHRDRAGHLHRRLARADLDRACVPSRVAVPRSAHLHPDGLRPAFIDRERAGQRRQRVGVEARCRIGQRGAVHSRVVHLHQAHRARGELSGAASQGRDAHRDVAQCRASGADEHLPRLDLVARELDAQPGPLGVRDLRVGTHLVGAGASPHHEGVGIGPIVEDNAPAPRGLADQVQRAHRRHRVVAPRQAGGRCVLVGGVRRLADQCGLGCAGVRERTAEHDVAGRPGNRRPAHGHRLPGTSGIDALRPGRRFGRWAEVDVIHPSLARAAGAVDLEPHDTADRVRVGSDAYANRPVALGRRAGALSAADPGVTGTILVAEELSPPGGSLPARHRGEQVDGVARHVDVLRPRRNVALTLGDLDDVPAGVARERPHGLAGRSRRAGALGVPPDRSAVRSGLLEPGVRQEVRPGARRPHDQRQQGREHAIPWASPHAKGSSHSPCSVRAMISS